MTIEAMSDSLDDVIGFTYDCPNTIKNDIKDSLTSALKIIDMINNFTSKHDLAVQCGSEWLYQSNEGQVDALELVGNILDYLASIGDPIAKIE